ncbi:MAG TPA: GGDEF domain-containing protein [Solirubrobacteraceae bacterium]|jgi:diguanylate cyclase (GGDEF)-like protein
MDVAGPGTDTSQLPLGQAPERGSSDGEATPRAVGDPLLAGVRRMTLLADHADDAEAIFRTLAHELLSTPGADEAHVYHLAGPGEEREQTVIYLFEGEGRLSYLVPREERPPGVSWVASTGRSFLAGDGDELAASVPRLALLGGDPGPAACALLLPLSVRGEVEDVVLLVRRRAEPFAERSVELAATLVDQAATALALLRARAEAGTDTVTGCMNHRGMRRQLHEEVGRAVRAGTPLSCMLIDLDNFKLVNDRHGHQAGDVLLREVGQTLVREVRAFDRVARYGGDEFVVILPNADLEPAAAAAQRALERLLAIPSFDATPGASASIGVAQWHAPMTIDELLEACDAALLRSKRQGKGRVTRASAPAS